MATTRCDCGHPKDDHSHGKTPYGEGHCLICSCAAYKFSEVKTFGVVFGTAPTSRKELERVLTYRGSVTDLATDIKGLLTKEEIGILIGNLLPP